MASRRLVAALLGAGQGIQSSQEMRMAELLRQLSQAQEQSTWEKRQDILLANQKDLEEGRRTAEIEEQATAAREAFDITRQMNPNVSLPEEFDPNTIKSPGGLNALTGELGKKSEILRQDELREEAKYEDRFTTSADRIDTSRTLRENAEILGIKPEDMGAFQNAYTRMKRAEIQDEQEFELTQKKLYYAQEQLLLEKERDARLSEELGVRKTEVELKKAEMEERLKSGGYTLKEQNNLVWKLAEDHSEALAFEVLNIKLEKKEELDPARRAAMLRAGQDVTQEIDYSKSVDDWLTAKYEEAGLGNQLIDKKSDVYAEFNRIKTSLIYSLSGSYTSNLEWHNLDQIAEGFQSLLFDAHNLMLNYARQAAAPYFTGDEKTRPYVPKQELDGMSGSVDADAKELINTGEASGAFNAMDFLNSNKEEL